MASLTHLSDVWQRRPNVVHWTAVGAIALFAAVLVVGSQGRARTAAAAWGTPARVLAAQVQLPIGAVPLETQVDVVDVPAHLVPAGALTSRSQLGELSRVVPVGGVLTTLDVDSAASVAAGRRGIGVAVVAHAPELAPGTFVELLLYPDIDPFDPGIAVTTVARVPAHILTTDAERWFVEVDPAHVEAVAQTSATGVVVPVVIGVNAIRQ